MRVATALLAAALLVASPALAQAAGPRPPPAKADEDFVNGRKAMEQGDYVTALRLFRESHARDPGRGKLLNIAICQEKLGLLWDALQNFKEVDPQISATDERRAIVDQHIKDLGPRIPHLLIKLSPEAPAGAQVSLDAAALDSGSLGVELPVNPGQHILLVTAPGAAEKRYDVGLEEGKTRTIEVGGPAGEGGGDSGRRSIAPGAALIVLGAAGIGAGIAFVALREDRRTQAVTLRDSIVADGARCLEGASNYDAARCPVLKSTTSEGDAFGTGALAAFIVGGAALAGGVTYLLWPAKKAEDKVGAGLTIAPVVGPGAQGLWVSGTF